jgi:hypothetical protein
MNGVDNSVSLAWVRRRYGRLASVYERSLGERLLYARARQRAIELLRLAPGATEVDFACDTGLNFPLLEQRIGELFVSQNTAKTHARSIYRKLNASGRAEAVADARELGLL